MLGDAAMHGNSSHIINPESEFSNRCGFLEIVAYPFLACCSIDKPCFMANVFTLGL